MTFLDSAAQGPMMDMALLDGEAMPGADEAMSEAEFQSLVSREIENAIDFVDTDIAPTREAATLYYRGALFGDEQEGRSKVISRDVHDTVNAILPSLMRVFFGGDKVVQFMPQGPEDVAAAEQATDYINYIVMRDNPGFSVFWDAFKDALVRKQGVVQYSWDNSVAVSQKTYTGLDEMGLVKLMQDLSSAQEAEIVGDLQMDESGIRVTVKLKNRMDARQIKAGQLRLTVHRVL